MNELKQDCHGEKKRKKERQGDKKSERDLPNLIYVSGVAEHIKCSGDILYLSNEFTFFLDKVKD